MNNVKVLDCTLRDGGRLFNCEFSDYMIRDMINRLARCRIDIIEVGFLRGNDSVEYRGNSTFFTDTQQIEKLVGKGLESEIVVFIDYGLYDFESLKPYDGRSVSGIRFGFTRMDLRKHREDVLRCMDIIKECGYRLYIQNVNTPGYDDNEVLELINICNEKKPYSYGIVDTYGSMYLEDLRHYYNLIHSNLDSDICIDFHSHNNFQLSFALALEIIELSERSGRTLIIDASLNGMGKGAGNLNEELIVDWLVRKRNKNYDFDCMLDLIDTYLKEIKKTNTWGYSIPAMLSGIYRAHPNNMLYLTEKYDLASKDIKVILSSEQPEERERYNYERLNQLCEKYRETKIDDEAVMDAFRKKLSGKTVLLIMPGATVKTERKRIENVIDNENPVIMSVNFVFTTAYAGEKYAFFGSADRYRAYYDKCTPESTILSSHILPRRGGTNIVNYESLVDRINDHFDNTATLSLNFLKKCEVKRILIAGFDGYNDSTVNYFENGEFQSDIVLGDSEQINKDIQELFSRFYKSVCRQIDVRLITTTRYHIPEVQQNE